MYRCVAAIIITAKTSSVNKKRTVFLYLDRPRHATVPPSWIQVLFLTVVVWMDQKKKKKSEVS